MKNKFYIVTEIETHEKSSQIEWEILNCLGIWTVEGKNEADREVKLWEKVEEYLGTKLASLTYENNKPHALTAFKQTVFLVAQSVVAFLQLPININM